MGYLQKNSFFFLSFLSTPLSLLLVHPFFSSCSVFLSLSYTLTGCLWNPGVGIVSKPMSSASNATQEVTVSKLHMAVSVLVDNVEATFISLADITSWQYILHNREVSQIFLLHTSHFKILQRQMQLIAFPFQEAESFQIFQYLDD